MESLYHNLQYSWPSNKQSHVIFWRHPSCDTGKRGHCAGQWRTSASLPSFMPSIHFLSLSFFPLRAERSQTKETRLRQLVHKAGNFAVQKHVISQKPGDQKDVLLGAVIVSALLARTFPYRWTFKWRLTDICFLLFYRTAKPEAAPRSSASLLEPIISVWGTWHSNWPPVKYGPMGLLCLTVFGQLGTVQTGFRKACVCEGTQERQEPLHVPSRC